MNKCTEEEIDLKNETQLESFLEKVKETQPIMVRWNDRDEDEEEVRKSKILMTEGLLDRIKDGRLVLTSSKYVDENR